MGLFFIGGQRYLSELKYQSGIDAWQKGDNTEAINQILGATTYVSGQQDDYWRDLAQIYLVRVAEEVQKGTPDEQESQAIAILAGNAINSAKNATDVAPKNVANWTVRGFVYRQLINVIEGSGQWALTAYQKAAELEPSNPYIYTEMGRVYTAQKEIDKAKEQYDKALSLKSDYAEARFQIALAYVNDNKISEAITEMENAKSLSPSDTGIAFQLGLLYYNNDQMTKAKQEFNRVIAQNENYSNARYFLGLILDKEGKRNEAIAQFEKIQALNPDNEHVQKVLENLRAGKKALTGLTQEGVPIEEKPAEVK
jgi:cytochrome c-type biogenesis protein CcmH/NrfG